MIHLELVVGDGFHALFQAPALQDHQRHYAGRKGHSSASSSPQAPRYRGCSRCSPAGCSVPPHSTQHGQRLSIATIDQDATIVESHKRAAHTLTTRAGGATSR